LAAFDQVIAKAREDLEALEPQVDENGVETADSINARNAAQAKVWRLSTQRKQKEAYTNLCVKVCKAGVVTTETTPTSPVNFVEGRIYQVGNFWFAYDKEVRALRAFEDENALGVYLKPAARVAGLSPAYWASPFVLSYEQAGVVGISPLQISRTEAETLYNRYKEDLKKK
jgi:hypothetical protein